MQTEKSLRIAKNTAYLTVAFVGQKILSFIYFTLIARFAGVEDTGKYFFALSFTTVFSIFTDLGLNPVLIREGAKFKEKISKYLNNILAVKLLLSLITFMTVAVVINLLGYPPITKQLVYLAALVMVLDTFHLSFYGVFRARQTLQYEAIGVAVGQTCTLLLGGAALIWHWPIHFLILAVMANSVFNFLFALYLLFKKLNFRPVLSWDKKILKFLFKIALPFAIAGIFVKINFFDSVLISLLTSDKHVGWYSVPFKITFALQFIPMAFAASIFPAMSGLYISSRQKLSEVFEKSLMYLMIIAVPSAVGIAALADRIVFGVYGPDYWPSVLTLQILIFALIPVFLNFPVGSLLNACDRQTTNAINMGISTVVNIVLSVLLIIKFGIAGAAVSALFSHSLLFVLGMRWSPKIVSYNVTAFVKFSLKIAVSSLLMGAVLLYLKSWLHFIVLIPVGAFVFFILIYLWGALNKDDLRQIRRALFKKEKIAS